MLSVLIFLIFFSISQAKEISSHFNLLHLPLNYLDVASEKGERIHPTFNILETHTGIDLVATFGTLVFATHPGKIIKTSIIGGAGKAIALYDNITGFLTLYEHLSEYNVEKGKILSEEDVKNYGYVIGKSGDGSPTVKLSPHLHFEILDGDQIYTHNGISLPVHKWIEKADSSHLGMIAVFFIYSVPHEY